MLIEEGFFVKSMKDKTLHDIIVEWNVFVHLFKIELDELQQEFQRDSEHTLTNFKGSNGHCPTKKRKRG